MVVVSIEESTGESNGQRFAEVGEAMHFAVTWVKRAGPAPPRIAITDADGRKLFAHHQILNLAQQLTSY